jgi:hypothetical protein
MVPPFVERAFKEKVALLDDSNPIPNSLRD